MSADSDDDFKSNPNPGAPAAPYGPNTKLDPQPSNSDTGRKSPSPPNPYDEEERRRHLSSTGQQADQTEEEQPQPKSGFFSSPIKPWSRFARVAFAALAIMATAPFIGPAAILVGIAAYNTPEIANAVVNTVSAPFNRSGSADISEKSYSRFSKEGLANRNERSAVVEQQIQATKANTVSTNASFHGIDLDAAEMTKEQRKAYQEVVEIADKAASKGTSVKEALETALAKSTEDTPKHAALTHVVNSMQTSHSRRSSVSSGSSIA